MGTAVLRLSGIGMSFGGVQALRGAHLGVRPGEVHGLVGEVMARSDRALTLSEGRLTGSFGPRARTDRGVTAAAAPGAGRSWLRRLALRAASSRELGFDTVKLHQGAGRPMAAPADAKARKERRRETNDPAAGRRHSHLRLRP
ncbi:MAG TPA: hypothetical protein VLH79_04180 [Chthonomonadales bacterium]|nr:hypothetical protein [Chthonomonadales bacterium]